MSSISARSVINSYTAPLTVPLPKAAPPPVHTNHDQVQSAQKLKHHSRGKPLSSAPPLQTPPSDRTENTLPPLSTDPLGDAVRQQFSGRPTLRSVVSELLRETLRNSTANEDIDINHLVISEPDPDNPTRNTQTPLVELALDYLVKGTALDFTGDRTLVDTRSRQTQGATVSTVNTLPIDLRALEQAVRHLTTQLQPAFISSVVSYWNSPAQAAPAKGQEATAPAISRRQWFSDILRDNLRITGLKHPGLDDVQRDTLDQVVRYPDQSVRPESEGATEASVFTLNTGLKHDPDSWDAYTYELLIVRTVGNRQVVMLYTPNGDITPYDSLQDFQRAWEQRLDQQFPLDQLKFGLEEPLGSIFDTQADNLLHDSLRKLSTLATPDPGQDTHDLAGQFSRASDPAAGFVTATRADPQVLEQTRKRLPQWLRHANDRDRYAYRTLGLQLASTLQRNQGRSYDHGIPDITQFAQQQLDAKLPKGYAAQDVSVVFKVAVGDLGSGYIERVPMSLTKMALENLAGLPKGEMEVYHNGRRVPELESGDRLKKLVQEVDIGKNYPELIKRTLVGKGQDTQERRSLFADQLAVELPLQALELALQKDSGFSARSYRYVEAIVSPGAGKKRADGQEIVIRPLAFRRTPNAQPDVVDNMFLIEPKDTTAGPHILYRPLTDTPLLEFPTRAALMEAIAQPGTLQTTVLAWLRDQKTRDVYAHNGFREPHVHQFFQGDEFRTYEAPRPATLATAGYETADSLLEGLHDGKLMDHLYDANAHSLTSLAEEQSVSNRESRWASLKEGGFLVLNAVLPALRTPGMALGAMLQLDAIQNDLETLDDDKKQDKSAAVVDLLLNMMFALSPLSTHEAPHSLGEDRYVADRLPNTVENAPNTADTAPVRRVPDDINHALQFPNLHPRTRLVDLINSFEVPQPPHPGLPIAKGRLAGLYRIDGKLHAKANEKWYRVGADLDQVFLLDDNDKCRTGPFLKPTVDGSWEFKSVERLNGGQRTSADDNDIQTRYETLKTDIAALDKKLEFSKSLLSKTLDTYIKNRAQLLARWQAVDPSVPESDAHTRYQEQLKLTTTSRTQLNRMLETHRSNLKLSGDLKRSAVDILTPKKSTEKSSFFQAQRSELFLKLFEEQQALQQVYKTLAGESQHASDGEPLVRIIQNVKEANSSGYQKFVATLGNTVDQNEQMIRYLGERSALLEEWANDSPIGREHANSMVERLNAEKALLILDANTMDKIALAKDTLNRAQQAFASDPTNDQLRADKDDAELRTLKLTSELKITQLNAELAINKANIKLRKGQQKALIELGDRRTALAVLMVKAKLTLEQCDTRLQLSDARRALSNDPANTRLKDDIRLTQKKLEEIKQQLAMPDVIDELASDRKYTRVDQDKIPASTHNEALNLKLNTLGSLRELSLNKANQATYPPAELAIGTRISQRPLAPIVKLHWELLNETDVSEAKRRSQLTQLIDTYESLLEDCRQLQASHSVIIRPKYNDLLIKRLEELLDHAQQQQDILNQAERDSALNLASSSGHSQNRQSPIERKPPDSATRTPSPTEVQKEEAAEPAVNIPPPVQPAAPKPSLKALKAQAQALIKQWEQQERLVLHEKKKLKQPDALQKIKPLDWDHMLREPASNLLELANKTEATHGDDPACAQLVEQWRTRAEAMRKSTCEHVRDAYVLQAPSAANVAYLFDQRLVTLEPVGRVFPTRAGDVFTEYVVRDSREPHDVLWYAHFHYATEEDALTRPASHTFAHLKLPSQQKLTQKDLNMAAGKNTLADKIEDARIRAPLDEIYLNAKP